jgi:cytochrome c-type biogenesis protein CcmH/NrfG
MKRESWILGIAGVFFGVLVGWIIATQMVRPAGSLNPSVDAAASSGGGEGQGQGQPTQNPTSPSGSSSTAQPVDEARVRDLTAQAEKNPKDAALRAQIGNIYFDAERYGDSIKWYEASLAIDPKNADVSTDLGVGYYYTNQTDRALDQFAASLKVNPNHTKTLLNIGMVKAFGKRDLNGAAEAWKRVVELAPADSPEGRAARQALDALKQAHPDTQ